MYRRERSSKSAQWWPDQRLRAGVSTSIRRLAPSYYRIHTIKDGTGISIVGGAEPLGKAAANGCQFRTRRCGVAHVCHRRAAPVGDPQRQKQCALPLRPYSRGRECGVRALYVWRPGERRPCSAGSSFCRSIALPPSAVRWHAALARFWASPNMLGATSEACLIRRAPRHGIGRGRFTSVPRISFVVRTSCEDPLLAD
jgi:hypothetical protein